MKACGAGWRVRTTFLGAVRSPWGLSLSSPVGLGTWLPPTYVGARDHRPTAVSAPRSLLHRLFASATSHLPPTNADPKAALRREALARRGAVAPAARLAFSRRLADEGLRLARLWRPEAVSAFHAFRDEPDTLELLSALTGQGFATALPIVAGRGSPLTFRLWRPGEPTRAGPMSIAEPLETAPAVDPDLLFVPLACFDRRGHRIGYGAGYYDRTLAGLRATKPVHAVGVGYGVCEVAAVPYEAHDQSLDAIVTDQETILFPNR
jgi:5-formyltetrahydrofolate cyclo-ligase